MADQKTTENDKLAPKGNFLKSKHIPFEKTNAKKSTKFDTNTNIYKNDPKYKMDRYLQFISPNEEEQCHYQYSKEIKISIFFIGITYLQNIIKIRLINDIIDYACAFLICATLAFAGFFLFFDENSVFHKKRKEGILRFLFSISKLSIIIQHLKDHQQISIYSIIFTHLSSLILNMIFDGSVDECIMIYLSNFFTIFLGMIVYQIKEHESLVIRMILFLFSIDGISLIIITAVIIVLNFLIRKGRREIWALYDSFKNSYHNINNCLMTCVNFPLFIITKKKGINYKNKSAEDFCQLFLTTNRPQKGSHDINNFQDLLINDKLFDYHLANISSTNARGKSSFFYPFITKNNAEKEVSKMKVTDLMLLSGDLTGLRWYMIMVSPCLWKNTECYFMELIPYEDMYFEEFIEKNFEALIDKLTDLIDDFDLCLWKIKDPVNLSEKFRKGSSIQPKRPRTDSVYQTVNYPLFDYSIIFFFQDKCQLIYDVYLTIQVFSWFYTHKSIHTKDNIHLDQLVASLSEYFCLPAHLNNFNIEYDVKGPTNFKISYIYLRIVLVNLILFVLYNSKDKTKCKTVNFTIEVQKGNEIDKDDEKDLLKIGIEYEDTDPIIVFNTLSSMLNDPNLAFSSFESEINKTKCFSFGLLVINYISNMIYNTPIVLASEANFHRISFHAKGKILGNNPNTNYVKFYYKDDHSISRYHFNQILSNVYKSENNAKDYKFFKVEIAKKFKWSDEKTQKETEENSSKPAGNSADKVTTTSNNAIGSGYNPSIPYSGVTLNVIGLNSASTTNVSIAANGFGSSRNLMIKKKPSRLVNDKNITNKENAHEKLDDNLDKDFKLFNIIKKQLITKELNAQCTIKEIRKKTSKDVQLAPSKFITKPPYRRKDSKRSMTYSYNINLCINPLVAKPAIILYLQDSKFKEKISDYFYYMATISRENGLKVKFDYYRFDKVAYQKVNYKRKYGMIYDLIIVEVFNNSSQYIQFIQKIRHREITQKEKENCIIALAHKKNINIIGDLFNDHISKESIEVDFLSIYNKYIKKEK